MEREKYVDESWKEDAETQKEKLSEIVSGQPAVESEKPSEPAQSEPSQQGVSSPDAAVEQAKEPSESEIAFINYLSSLGFQAMIFLGEVPNPITNEADKNLEQAKFLIDTIVMLQAKTKGNLSSQEENLINATAYELQLKYVAVKEQEKTEEESNG